MNSPERVVFLLDMDAFFASVEERENPSLKGKPLIVVGSASSRSVVSAANYAARKYGLHSAMPFTRALSLCPHVQVATAQHDLYRQVSKSIFSICETFTDLLEISSIDECYMDMTPTADRFGGPLEAARLLKEKIRGTEGLTCTIGIAPNKLLAKLAAEMKKPDGLSQVTAAEVPSLLESLPLSSLHGIGQKTAEKLKAMGIKTAGELGRCDKALLCRAFGTNGGRLVEMGQGLDDSPVVPYYQRALPKSISHEHTLDEDTRDIELLKRTLHYLAERVAYRLRKQGLSAGTVSLVLRFNDLQRINRSHTIPDRPDDGLTIYHTALPLLEQALKDPRPVRLIGVSTENLQEGILQQGLFDNPRKRDLTRAVDYLNEKLGKMAIKPASLVEREKMG